MKAIRTAALIALIAMPGSAFAWSRGGAVVVRPGFPSRAVFVSPGFPNRGIVVRPGFANEVVFINGFPRRVAFVRPGFPGRFIAPGFIGGVATGIVLNPFFFPRSFYFPGPTLITILRATLTILITIHLPILTRYHPRRLLPWLRATPTIADIPKDTPRVTRRLRESATKSAMRKAKNAATRRATASARTCHNPYLRLPENPLLVKEKVSVISAAKIQTYQTTRRAERRRAIESRARERAFVFVGKKTAITEAGAAVRTIEFVGI